MKILAGDFFERDSHQVAQQLLGRVLCRQIGRSVLRFTIDEVEVYDGFEDRASHAFAKNSRDGRAALMYGPAGIWYVYLCYGIHWMLNVVTREKGYPGAILIRGCKEASGPGRLTRALKIDGKFNGKLVAPETKLWLEEPAINARPKIKIQKTPRIGVDYAGPHWSKQLYRYTIAVS